MLTWWITIRKKKLVLLTRMMLVVYLTRLPIFSRVCLSVTGYGEVLTALLLLGNVTGACSINYSKRFTVN